MSRIFISHSSVDNAAALAVTQWLRDNGWDDYFLDMTPTRGLAPGTRWTEELKAAAHRCEAVLLLVSPAWRDSEWCQAEFLLARLLGVAILPVLVQSMAVDTLRSEMVAELQIGDLVTGDDRVSFAVSHPIVPPTQVAFSRSGLEGLRQGLRKAGLDPTTFAWPPPDQPRRSPYPGLKPLDVEDAAVFFGRDARIIEGLNTLRGLRERGVQRMLVILGASGAGKSSFLRAGLWPRLQRDDRQFLPLPVIRPERAAISGTSGLAAVLEAAFLKYRRPGTKPRTRADIRGTLQQASGLDLLLCELQELARPHARTDELPPTVVIAIDQAEELFAADGRTEATVLLARLAETLGPPAGVDAEAIATRRRFLAVVTIRSDSYELLQTESKLAQVDPYLFSLPPLEPADYRAVIEGPAARASSAGSRLRIEPQLTDRLLNDTRGADALPLLAFTLERLFLECGADGDLRLDEYESLGGVRGSLEAAIAAAFAEPGRAPAIPEDEAERERRLRHGFIPWLALVDPDTRERKRRVARWDEIPDAAQPLLERLVAARLLTRDRRRAADAEQEIDVVEIAHEALLRQWESLTRWLDEDAGQLMLAQTVRRAAREWWMNGRHADWLSHTGERLREAEILRERSGFAELLGAEGQAYLLACRERDAADLRAAQEARQRELEDARRLKQALAAADLVAGRSDVKDGRKDLALARLARAVRLAPDHVTLRGEAVGLLTRAAVPRVFLMHEGPVRSARFSPDGSRVITASVDKTARVWDATTGRPVGEPLRHDDSVEAACFSPDGVHAVTASRDKTARVWDATTGRPAGAPLRHENAVLAASFSPDGSRVVTASQDKTARVWDTAAGQPVGPPLRHERTVHAASFSPDGSRVVTASDDKTARVWDADTGRPLGQPLRHRKGICIGSFSPDGTRVLTAGSLDDPAQVWDATTGEPVGEPMGHDSTVSGACFSPDGSRVVTASWDRTARMWDAATGQPVGEPLRHPGEVLRVAFSPDGSRVVTTCDDKSARVWDAAAGQPVGEPLRHDDSVAAAVFSPDGSRVVTASGGSARVWDTTTGRPAGEPLRHENAVNAASFSPDGSRVITASDRAARVWDAATGQPLIELLQHDDLVDAASFSSDGSRVLTASGSTVRVWDAVSGQLLGEPLRHDRPVSAALFSPDGSRVITASYDGTARVWDAATGQPLIDLLQDDDVVHAASFSPDGSRVVTASDDKTARVWDVSTGQPVGEPLRHENAVNAASFSPDGSYVLTASADTTRVWDAATGQPVGEPLRHDDHVTAASFSPDGSRVVTASSDRTARVWDAATGQPVGEPLRHDDEVKAALFSPDGSRVVTASSDKTARVWDATTGQAVGEPLHHDGGVRAAAFSPDGSRVVTASWDKTARVWDTVVGRADEAELLADLAEACSGYSISDAGAPVPLSDRADRLATLRRQALAAPAGMPTITSLARWLFEHPWHRTVSPLSRVTVADYIRGCLQSGARDEARRAFPGHPMLRDDVSTPPTRPTPSPTPRVSTSPPTT